jgi:hypothetical protein
MSIEPAAGSHSLYPRGKEIVKAFAQMTASRQKPARLRNYRTGSVVGSFDRLSAFVKASRTTCGQKHSKPLIDRS